MTRELVTLCLPALGALLAACLALVVLLRWSPARANFARLRTLHRCEEGGVQSLAFVLTLPIFITIVTFIVQVSQLLVGMMVVNYATFAAARAASVWIPAHLDDEIEPANILSSVAPRENIDNGQYVMTLAIDPDTTDSTKLRRVRAAAVMGCAGVSPSRSFGLQPITPEGIAAMETARRVYPAMVPTAVTGKTDGRIANKIAYSDNHTFVIIEWRDTSNDTTQSPTYMPRGAPSVHPAYDLTGGVRNDREVGWQDAVTVYVFHRYALISGAGRSLASRLSNWRRMPQRVLDQLPPEWTAPVGVAGQPVVIVGGTATVTNEGLKSVRPYNQPRY